MQGPPGWKKEKKKKRGNKKKEQTLGPNRAHTHSGPAFRSVAFGRGIKKILVLRC